MSQRSVPRRRQCLRSVQPVALGVGGRTYAALLPSLQRVTPRWLHSDADAIDTEIANTSLVSSVTWSGHCRCNTTQLPFNICYIIGSFWVLTNSEELLLLLCDLIHGSVRDIILTRKDSKLAHTENTSKPAGGSGLYSSFKKGNQNDQ